jgi:hypothetical protein
LDYKEQSVTGRTWQRCCAISIVNPAEGTPHVSFSEERVTQLPDRKLSEPVSVIGVTFDPAEVIPLRDPRTGELTGASTTQGAIHAALYSAYHHYARERDKKAEAIASEQQQ